MDGLMRFTVILATILCTTTAVDFECLSHVNSNNYCAVVELDLSRVPSTEEVNIVIPEKWETSKINKFSIHTFATPVKFPTKLFNKFPNVKEAEIKISLKTISSEYFKQANALEELDLAFNNLTTIDDFAFNESPNLKKLVLSGNQLTKIRKNTFAGLSALLELHLYSNQIDEIEDGALNFPQLTVLDLHVNRLKVIPDLSKPTQWKSLKEINIGYNPLETVDFLAISKYEQLELLDVSTTSVNLDTLTVTAEDIQSSKSKLNTLNLSETNVKSGIIFAKLKIFPNLLQLLLKRNSLTTMDLDAIQTGGLEKLSTIWILGNNFDENWLQQAAAKVSMHAETEPYEVLEKN